MSQKNKQVFSKFAGNDTKSGGQSPGYDPTKQCLAFEILEIGRVEFQNGKSQCILKFKCVY